MEQIQENKMGIHPVGPLLISMALPAMFSMLIQALYNIVDSIFVAKVGEEALTAVSLAFPLQTMLIAVGVGTGVGLNSLISRRLGEKNQQAAESAAEHGILLGLISWAAFALFGVFFTQSFYRMFTDNPLVFQYSCDYTYVVLIFSFGAMMDMCLEKIIQGTGNMIYPMIIQLVGAVINIILDPIMIFGLLGCPAMGVRGAAIATVTGQIISMIVGLFLLLVKTKELHLSLKSFRFNRSTVGAIYAVGFPSIIMQSISAVLTVFLNGILIAFSDAAVSVLGVYFKLQSFVFMPVFGLTQGLMPILGYNYGARKKKRMMDAFRLSLWIALGIMVVGTVLFWIFPQQLLGMFSATEEMYRIGIPALRSISLCFAMAAVGIVVSNVFQAIGNGVYSLIISLLRQLILILPIAYLLSRLMGVTGVWYAFPIAEGVSMIASLVLFAVCYTAKIKPMPEPES